MTHEQFEKAAKVVTIAMGSLAAVGGTVWKLNDTLRDTIKVTVAETFQQLVREEIAKQNLATKGDVKEAKKAAIKTCRSDERNVDCPAFVVRAKQRVVCKSVHRQAEDEP